MLLGTMSSVGLYNWRILPRLADGADMDGH